MPGWKPLLFMAVVTAAACLVLLNRAMPEAGTGAEASGSGGSEAIRRDHDSPVLPPASPVRAPVPTEPELEPSFDTRGEPTLPFFRDAIETALRERLPGLKLSPDDVDRLARAARRLRAAQEALRRLPASPEVADRRRALTEAVAQAGAVFYEVTGLSSSEFTEAVAPEDGVDAFDPEEPIPAGEYLEPKP